MSDFTKILLAFLILALFVLPAFIFFQVASVVWFIFLTGLLIGAGLILYFMFFRKKRKKSATGYK